MPNLNETRANLSKAQRALLDEIWNSYISQNAWPLAWEINHPHRKAEVYANLKPLGSHCVFETNDGLVGSRYQLTLRGILLTTDGERLQKLLIDFLHYLRERYQANPKDRSILKVGAQEAMKLNDEDASMLGRLVVYGQLYSESASGGPDFGQNWSVGMFRDVEDWSRDGELSEQLETITTRIYANNGAVFLADRTVPYIGKANMAFVAMWFNSATDHLWTEAIQPAFSKRAIFHSESISMSTTTELMMKFLHRFDVAALSLRTSPASGEVCILKLVSV